MFVERRYESIINESGIGIFDRPRTPAMRETRVLCRSIRTRSIREQTSKAVPWRCDLSRLRNTRAKSAPRSVCTALRGWRNCARDRSKERTCTNGPHTRQPHEFLLENPRISAGSSSKRRNRRMDRDVVCARAIHREHVYVYIYTRTCSRSHARNERQRSFEANAFLCHNLAARAKHPALACQPTCSPPLLGSNSRRSCSTAPNVPKARLYWFRSYENRAI